MKKVFIYLILNIILLSFFIYSGYVLSTSSFISNARLWVKIIFGLLNYGITIIIIVEVNRKLKQYLNKKLKSHD